MKLTPRQRRTERRSRNQSMVDMNLVSLIDVFTILIFFLLSNSGGVETLPSPKAVKLPESLAETTPRETVVIAVSPTEITVDGRLIALVADVIDTPEPLIAPLAAELAQQQARHRGVAAAGASASAAADGQTAPLTIMGDKDIPYRLLRKIMATSARADFSNVSFAVRQRFEL